MIFGWGRGNNSQKKRKFNERKWGGGDRGGRRGGGADKVGGMGNGDERKKGERRKENKKGEGTGKKPRKDSKNGRRIGKKYHSEGGIGRKIKVMLRDVRLKGNEKMSNGPAEKKRTDCGKTERGVKSEELAGEQNKILTKVCGTLKREREVGFRDKGVRAMCEAPESKNLSLLPAKDFRGGTQGKRRR